VTRGLLGDGENKVLTCCHDCLDRLMRWTFPFYLVANANLRVRMISVLLANALATRTKIKIEPSSTQRIWVLLGCPKTPNVRAVSSRIQLVKRLIPGCGVQASGTCTVTSDVSFTIIILVFRVARLVAGYCLFIAGCCGIFPMSILC